MTDPFQQALHTAAVGNRTLAALAVFCANVLLFALVAGLAAVGLRHRHRLTWGLAARVAVSAAVAVLLTLLLGPAVLDPRPYLAEHYAPLAHVAGDNGFPSDHTLVAALLACWVWWLDRRLLPLFLAGLIAVMAGRLAIGAHHSLDVLGSVAFALIGFAVASWLPLPAGWNSRLLFPAGMGRGPVSS
jgi:membrane-associated phospholipid phosphatase